MRLFRTIVPLILAMFALSSGFLFISESQGHLHNRAVMTSASQSFFRAGNTPFSRAAREDALLTCDELLTPPVVSFQVAQTNIGNAKRCLVLAKGVAKQTPSLALGHYVAGLSASYLSDRLAGLEHMRRSQEFGPYEGWLAERRFVFLIKNRGPDTKAVIKAEIAALLVTQSGAELIARHFVNMPTLRDQIKVAANAAKPAEQHRFLNVLARLDGET